MDESSAHQAIPQTKWDNKDVVNGAASGLCAKVFIERGVQLTAVVHDCCRRWRRRIFWINWSAASSASVNEVAAETNHKSEAQDVNKLKNGHVKPERRFVARTVTVLVHAGWDSSSAGWSRSWHYFAPATKSIVLTPQCQCVCEWLSRLQAAKDHD